MMRAPVLHDTEPPGGHLLGDPMIEQNDAIGDIFFQTLAGELPFAALAGDNGGDALVLEPAKQPSQFRTQDRGIGKATEERFNGVQHHALGRDGVDGQPQTDE